ncbi:hypothetical protein D3C72_1953880 [compost metagenome]
MMANTPSIFGWAVSKFDITVMPPSRLPPAFWLSDRILISLNAARVFLQPLTRSITDVTGGPFKITTLPLPPICFAR